MKTYSQSKVWKIWAKALGEKAFPANKDSDKVAWVRTFLILQAIVTNVFIISGVIRHW